MYPYYPYELALSASSGSFPSRMYGPRVAAAGEELIARERRQAGMVPHAPTKLYNGRRPRISNKHARRINERRGNLPYTRISNDPYAWAIGPQMLRGTVAATPERGFNPKGRYNGAVPAFSLDGDAPDLDGDAPYLGGRRTRRRRTTKKRTRKQRR